MPVAVMVQGRHAVGVVWHRLANGPMLNYLLRCRVSRSLLGMCWM